MASADVSSDRRLNGVALVLSFQWVIGGTRASGSRRASLALTRQEICGMEVCKAFRPTGASRRVSEAGESGGGKIVERTSRTSNLGINSWMQERLHQKIVSAARKLRLVYDQLG